MNPEKISDIRKLIKYLRTTLYMFEKTVPEDDFVNPNSDVYQLFTTIFKMYSNAYPGDDFDDQKMDKLLTERNITTENELTSKLMRKAKKHQSKTSKYVPEVKKKKYISESVELTQSGKVQKLYWENNPTCETEQFKDMIERAKKQIDNDSEFIGTADRKIVNKFITQVKDANKKQEYNINVPHYDDSETTESPVTEKKKISESPPSPPPKDDASDTISARIKEFKRLLKVV